MVPVGVIGFSAVNHVTGAIGETISTNGTIGRSSGANWYYIDQYAHLILNFLCVYFNSISNSAYLL